MSSFGKSWDAMEGATLTAVGLKPDTFSRFNEVLSTVDFLPLLALSLWHTDLIVIPPFTRFVLDLHTVRPDQDVVCIAMVFLCNFVTGRSH